MLLGGRENQPTKPAPASSDLPWPVLERPLKGRTYDGGRLRVSVREARDQGWGVGRMDAGRRERTQVDRRTFLKLATGAGLATVGGLGPAPWVQAASEVTLSIWTGFPELVPFYKAVA